jgi:hypothetical protein
MTTELRRDPDEGDLWTLVLEDNVPIGVALTMHLPVEIFELDTTPEAIRRVQGYDLDVTQQGESSCPS